MSAEPAARPTAGEPVPSGRRRVARAAVEFLPPFVVALLILPFVIAYGHLWPWKPSTIDLQVYVYAVKDMLAGKDIFATTTPFWNLYFIYPPIAAVLMTPLAFGPYTMWQVLWTAGLVWAQQSVLRRCRAPRGWKLGLIGIAVLVAMEPIRTTLGYGQVNTILMAFVVADMLPDRATRWKRFPQGVLTGLAASIKLTPALFVVFDFLIGKKKTALWAIAGFVGFTAIGAIFLPHQTLSFWTGLAGGDTRTAGPIYAGNQSLLGVFFRLAGGGGTKLTLIGLGFAGIVALIGAIVASTWWRSGQKVFAVAIVGMCTCLASPLSWTHHYVWVLPLAMAVMVDRLPRWVRIWAGAWVLWICACLPLAALPYGGSFERNYTAFQQVVANLGPVMGAGLVIALGIRMVLRSMDRVPAPPTPVGSAA
ncbi:glycosyltransferase 87 family protein [Microlunatus ginsengisoli]|uniref:Glycosyltransferase 87 family protein n=1 Tax=Microlunatus ginsengisoli TaxID=363863 RepID=A0ABP7A3D7_9ACTN